MRSDGAGRHRAPDGAAVRRAGGATTWIGIRNRLAGTRSARRDRASAGALWATLAGQGDRRLTRRTHRHGTIDGTAVGRAGRTTLARRRVSLRSGSAGDRGTRHRAAVQRSTGSATRERSATAHRSAASDGSAAPHRASSRRAADTRTPRGDPAVRSDWPRASSPTAAACRETARDDQRAKEQICRRANPNRAHRSSH